MISSNERSRSISVGKTVQYSITLYDYASISAMLEIMRTVADRDFTDSFSFEAVNLAKEIQEQWKNL